jgi:hypothetical protein
MSAKSVRNTASIAKILIKLDTTWTIQVGNPVSQESSHCFALRKTWSIDLLIPDEENR